MGSPGAIETSILKRCPFRKRSYTSREFHDGKHRAEHWYRDNTLHFVTARCHDGAACFESDEAKTKRRVMIYRCSPHVRRTRYNYIPSDALLARLTPARRQIVQAVPPRMRPGRVLKQK